MDLIESQIQDPINYWYYRHKFFYIKKFFGLPSKVTDIGAGSALFSKELLKYFKDTIFYAHDPNYSNQLDGKMIDGITFSKKSTFNCSDVYLLTDVLEHVENDEYFLRNIVKNAPLNSKFIITVPCFSLLWSAHDIYLKHFRRYKKKELTQLIKNSGLEIKYFQYLYFALFTVALVSRKFLKMNLAKSQLKEVNKITNFILYSLCRIDEFLGPLTPFGISCVVVAVKTN